MFLYILYCILCLFVYLFIVFYVYLLVSKLIDLFIVLYIYCIVYLFISDVKQGVDAEGNCYLIAAPSLCIQEYI